MDVVDFERHAQSKPHRISLKASSSEALAQGIPTLLRLIENLCPTQVDLKHRRLRPGNATLQERVFGPLPCAFEMLCFLGYTPLEESGETVLSLDVSKHRPAAAAREAQWVRDLVEQRWRLLPWPCPTCTLQNNSRAEVCAACEGPRPLRAAPPIVPPPRLVSDQAQLVPKLPQKSARSFPEERQECAEHFGKVRSEKFCERQRILDEAKADRERFAESGASGSTGRLEEPINIVAHVPTTISPGLRGVDSSRVVLRVRLPDGVMSEKAFDTADSLDRVFTFVDGQLLVTGEMPVDYALLQSIPRRVFLREVLGMRSLAELALGPSAMLSVLRGADRGRVQSGGVETALLTGEIDGLSYDELQELEVRMGDAGKRARRATKHDRESLTTLHVYGCSLEASSGSGPKETKCAICLTDFEIGDKMRSLWCSHSFHQVCVDRWFVERDECPVCRVPLHS